MYIFFKFSAVPDPLIRSKGFTCENVALYKRGLLQIGKKTQLINKLLSDRDVEIFFGLSKQTVLNELDDYQNTLSLQPLGFFEAFARMAGKSSQPQFTDDAELESYWQLKNLD